MRKILTALIVSSLVWAHSPAPALAQVQAHVGTASSIGAGSAAQAGAALRTGPVGGAAVSPMSLTLGSLAPLTPLPGLSPTVERGAPPAVARTAHARSKNAAASPAARDLGSMTAPAGSAAAPVSASFSAMPAKAGTAVPVRPATSETRTSRASPALAASSLPGNAAPESRASALGRLSVLQGRAAAASPADIGGLLDKTYSGTAVSKSASPVPSEDRTLSRRSGLKEADARPAPPKLATEPAVDAVVKAKTPKRGRPPKKRGLREKIKSYPRSYWMYLTGQFLYALGQEAASLLVPLFAYFTSGLAFALTVQATALAGQLAGGFLGSKWVKKFNSKTVYIWANRIHSAAFLLIPAIYFLAPAAFPAYLLGFKTLSGFIYGALRGVAEKEITTRILGQKDKRLLQEAGSLFYAVFEGAELVSALATGALIALMGHSWSAVLMAVVMATSLIPMRLIKFKAKGKEKGEDKDKNAGTEKSLPIMMYLPFVFSFLMHIALYDFFAPFIALEVFQQASMGSLLVGLYTAGSLAVSLFSWIKPKLASKLSERQWSLVGAATTLAFLWGTLLLQSPAVSLGLAFLLGVGITEVQIQWRALYQKRLSQDAQPRVYNKLNVWSVVGNLFMFGLMQAGLLLAGASMETMMIVVSAVLTGALIGVPLGAKLIRRLRGGPREPAK